MCRSVRGRHPRGVPFQRRGCYALRRCLWQALEGARPGPAAPLDAGTCPVAVLCVLRPASAWGVLLRQNSTASEISDARFRAIYSGMRKLPPVKK